MNVLHYITRAGVYSNNDPYPVSDICNPLVSGVGERSTWMFADVIVLWFCFSRLMPGHTQYFKMFNISLYEANM